MRARGTEATPPPELTIQFPHRAFTQQLFAGYPSAGDVGGYREGQDRRGSSGGDYWGGRPDGLQSSLWLTVPPLVLIESQDRS